MLKKILSYIFIIIGLFFLWASTSRNAMQYISQKRDNNEWWGSYQCLKGDLVSMAYLDIVKRFNPLPENENANRAAYNVPKSTILYLHGDSYSRHLSDSDFAGVRKYIPIDRNHGINYHLDTANKNILLIEISERYFRLYFSGLQILDEVCDSVIKKKTIAWSQDNEYPAITEASILPKIGVSDLFNKYINQNLQCNLFNYNFMMPLFESKAALNYYVFNRASGDVVISNDHNYLFLKETVTKTGINSSFSPLQDDEINKLVHNLNTAYDHYKSTGFKEVYLSIIPNSATILQPAGYNNLIPLLQSNPGLKIKIIDIYTVFKKTYESVYLPGDTHWNNKGRQLWLKTVNEKLLQL